MVVVLKNRCADWRFEWQGMKNQRTLKAFITHGESLCYLCYRTRSLPIA